MPTTTASPEQETEREILDLLAAQRAGDPGAHQALFARLYDELRALASGYVRGERAAATAGPTALVHDLFVRLSASSVDCRDRDEFLRLAATVMRRILIDGARRREARRNALRGVEPAGDEDEERDRTLLALEDAVERLAEIDGELARVVELRFFAGLNVEQTAEVLAVSTPTVKRRWRTAKAWLQREITGGDRDGA